MKTSAIRSFPLTLIATALAGTFSLPASAISYVWTGSPDQNYSATGFPSSLGASDTLAINAGPAKYLNLALGNAGTISASDTLYLYGGNALTNGGLYDLLADVDVSNAYGGSFVNNAAGTLRKSGGGGTSNINLGFTNNGGVIDVQTGILNFISGSATFNGGTQFTGAGQVVVSNNASFNDGFTTAGNLSLTGGTATGGGAGGAMMNGNVSWTGGNLGGTWTVNAGNTLSVQSGAAKYVNASLTNQGTIAATDVLYLYGGNALTNNSVYALQGDVDVSNAYGGSFVNGATGTLRKSAGSGTSQINLAFTNNGGAIDVRTGVLKFVSGNATFNGGTQFTGAGQVVVASNASFNGAYTTANNLLLTAGTFTGTGAGAVMNGNTSWTDGFLAGTWTVGAGYTLSVQSGAAKYVNGSLTNQGTIAATDTLYMYGGNALTNNTIYDLKGDVGISNAYGGAFVNNGILVKSAGTGTSAITLTYTNGATGVIQVQTGTIDFTNGDAVFGNGTQFTGAGLVTVSNSATFNGGYTTAGNLRLTGGNFTGGGAQINGATTWTGGTLAGTWTVGAGNTLSVQSGAAKYVNASLSNQGTIAATDVLYVYGGNVLTNNAIYDLHGDVDIGNAYGGTFVNNGTLVKSAGTGTSAITATYTNGASGVVQVQTGTIDFRNGDATFGNGTQFTGAGLATVSNSATFNGGYHASGNLRLTGGNFNGGSAQMNGATTWTGGTLAGTWTVGAGSTLNVQSGPNPKYVNASLTNQGTIAATDTLYVYGGNTLTNSGLYDLQGDVGVGNAYGGSFVNGGTLRKSGGAATSTIDLAFSNPAGGRMVMDSGTIALTQAFANAGTLDFGLSGSGSFGTLALAGATALGGQVGVHFLGGYLPSVGDSFQLITYGSYSGGFANASWAFADGGKIVTFDPVYHSGDFTLTVQSIQAVPEPSTYAMLLAGLAAVGFVARRRRG